MEFLADNMTSLVLGVVVPLSTMAVMAVECGGTRQPVRSKKKLSKHGAPSKSRKHGGVSSKSRSCKDKSSRLSSTNRISKSRKLKKDQLKQSAKENAKEGSSKAKETAQDASGKLKQGVKEASGKLKQGAKEATGKAKQGVKEASGKFKQSVKEASGKAKQGAKETSEKFKQSKDASKKAIDEELADASSKDSSVSHTVSKSNRKPRSSSKCEGRAKAASAEHLKTSESGVEDALKPAKGTKHETYGRRSAELADLVLEPNQLSFSTAGGLQQITVHNRDPSGSRHAVKVKCSDNGLYRVNPVYAFVEPGKSLKFNVYRNNSAVTDAKIDKLVLALAEVSKQETNPASAFKDRAARYPMMVMPLLSSAASDAYRPANRFLCVK